LYVAAYLELKLMTLMRPDELRQLGEDIKANGMKVPIILLHQDCGLLLLGGPNRLDALEYPTGRPVDPEPPASVHCDRPLKMRGAAP
jgi:hypothetical protein